MSKFKNMDMNMDKQHMLVQAACPSTCPHQRYISMPISLRYAHVHAIMYISMLYVHAIMSMSMLYVHVHAICPCPCNMSMSMLYVHVHAICPCPCYMSMSMLYVHVHAICPFHFVCPCPCYMSIPCSTDTDMPNKLGHASWTSTCSCHRHGNEA
jgi:hypothetical protein